MAIRRTQRLVLRKSKMILTSTVFDQAQEYADADVENTVNLLDKIKYVRRHVVFKGEFKASFPGTTESDEFGQEGYVFPTKQYYALSNAKFRITPLIDNSIYYCVIPVGVGALLDSETYNLVKDQTFTFEEQNVYFIFCNSYYLNGESKTGNLVVACENSSSYFLANDTCQIIRFKTVE